MSWERLAKIQSHLAPENCASSAKQPTRGEFKYFLPIQTRWKDNDQYGHVNNAVYYDYFDSVINHWLIHEGGLKIGEDLRGLVVNSSCDFLASVQYPAVIDAGLRVSKIGSSSLHWDVAIFACEEPSSREGPRTRLVAHGRMIHVFVRGTPARPTDIPTTMRKALERDFFTASS